MTISSLYGHRLVGGPRSADIEATYREKSAKPPVGSFRPNMLMVCNGPICNGKRRSSAQFVDGSELCHKCAGRKA